MNFRWEIYGVPVLFIYLIVYFSLANFIFLFLVEIWRDVVTALEGLRWRFWNIWMRRVDCLAILLMGQHMTYVMKKKKKETYVCGHVFSMEFTDA